MYICKDSLLEPKLSPQCYLSKRHQETTRDRGFSRTPPICPVVPQEVQNYYSTAMSILLVFLCATSPMYMNQCCQFVNSFRLLVLRKWSSTGSLMLGRAYHTGGKVYMYMYKHANYRNADILLTHVLALIVHNYGYTSICTCT